MLKAEIIIKDPEMIKDFFSRLSSQFVHEEGTDYSLLLLIEKDTRENITTAYYEIRGTDKHRFKLYEINHYIAEKWLNEKGFKLELTPR